MNLSELLTTVSSRVEQLNRDDRGVAYTEYIIVFSLVAFGGTVALLSSAAFVKAYRDFMVWWLAHPAV